MGRVAVHGDDRIAWQGPAAARFVAGLKALGVDAYVTTSRTRETDAAVLLGTTLWRGIERDGDYLLVDRASYGDPDFVQLVWNGHGRRGDHCVPPDANGRWYGELHPWRTDGHRVVLCGQTEPYSPHYEIIEQWYEETCAATTVTHFRPHPVGGNPTGLPELSSWAMVGRVLTLNSSVAVESVMQGIPTVTMDEHAMAWQVTAHNPRHSVRPDRRPWLEWLAWTQWHWSEIEQGQPIRHLFEGRL